MGFSHDRHWLVLVTIRIFPVLLWTQAPISSPAADVWCVNKPKVAKISAAVRKPLIFSSF
jgi:hypothetical protein